MEQDPMSRVACETATTTGLVMVMGEITTKAYVDIQKIVRDTVREIGYDESKIWFRCRYLRCHHCDRRAVDRYRYGRRQGA